MAYNLSDYERKVDSNDSQGSSPHLSRKASQLVFITSTGPANKTEPNLDSQRQIKVQARRYTSKIVPQSPVNGENIPQKYNKRTHTSRFKLSTWTRKPPKNLNLDQQIQLAPINASLGFPLVVELPVVNSLPIPLTPAVTTIMNYCRCNCPFLARLRFRLENVPYFRSFVTANSGL
jgi:hypothetical protein